MVLLADAEIVSTRSRPKAAGRQAGHFLHRVFVSTHSRPKAAGKAVSASAKVLPVSTHSRPKAAGGFVANKGRHREFQLTAARRRLVELNSPEYHVFIVSTHSRPKAAGFCMSIESGAIRVSTHSRPKAAGRYGSAAFGRFGEFQLTAARRRLVAL